MLLVVLFDPAAALPSVDRELLRPHTLQRCSKVGGALVNIGNASVGFESAA
jgi:hypothetical protein